MPSGKNINDSELNQNELAFCYEYIANKFNGTKAAIAAGYSAKGADVRASELLGRRKVKEKIEELTEKYLSKIEVTGEKIIQELAKLGFSDMKNHVEFDGEELQIKSFDELGNNTACIREFDVVETEIMKGMGKECKIKFKLHDKKGALELLGKNLQMFTDKVDMTSGGERLTAPVIYIPDNGRRKTED